MTRGWTLLALLVVGCVDARDGQFRCPDGECPDGLVCAADRVCRRPGADAAVDASTADASPRDAGRPPDAAPDGGERSDGATPDAGLPDASTLDGGADAAVDAGTALDAGIDAGTAVDAGVDAGTDAGVDAGPACGLTMCGASCVDTQTDRLHCGGCERLCPRWEACVAGRCECDGAADGAECGVDTRYRCCAGSCRQTWADPTNCGGCGIECPTDSCVPAGSPTVGVCAGCTLGTDSTCPSGFQCRFPGATNGPLCECVTGSCASYQTCVGDGPGGALDGCR